MANKELFIYPYLSKVRMAMIISDTLETVHKINFDNAVKAFTAMMTGEECFKSEAKSENDPAI